MNWKTWACVIGCSIATSIIVLSIYKFIENEVLIRWNINIDSQLIGAFGGALITGGIALMVYWSQEKNKKKEKKETFKKEFQTSLEDLESIRIIKEEFDTKLKTDLTTEEIAYLEETSLENTKMNKELLSLASMLNKGYDLIKENINSIDIKTVPSEYFNEFVSLKKSVGNIRFDFELIKIIQGDMRLFLYQSKITLLDQYEKNSEELNNKVNFFLEKN